MSETGSRSSSIMSVAEVIDSAFGLPNENTVNHKLIQAVLFILAKQLKVLERQVEVVGSSISPSSSTLSVTEVRLQARKKALVSKISGVGVSGIKETHPKGPPGGSLRKGPRKKATTGTVLNEEQSEKKEFDGDQKLTKKEKEDKKQKEKKLKEQAEGRKSGDESFSSSGTSSPKGFYPESTRPKKKEAEQTRMVDEPMFDKTSLQKSSLDKASETPKIQKLSSDKAAADDLSLEKTPKLKFSQDQFYSEEVSSDKNVTDKRTSEDRKEDKVTSPSDTYKETIDSKQTTPPVDKTTSAEKSSLDRPDSIPTEKASSPDTTGYDKTFSDKAIKERTLSDTTSQPTATEKVSVKSSDYTSKEILSGDILTPTSPSEKVTADQTSSAKTSTPQTKSSDAVHDKSAAEIKKDKISSSGKSTPKFDSDKTSAGKGASSTSIKNATDESKEKKPRLDLQLLQTLEEKRERVLRIIHQRASSREEHDKLPTPMASLDSIEAEYEKLLVVERVSSKEAKEREKAARKGQAVTPKLSIVTQEEFDALAQTVRRIQEKYKEIGRLELPENVELMHELRKGASLTDAMGALQLSARLEAAEKTLQNMMNLVTELASKTPGVDITVDDGMEVLYGAKSKSPASRIESVSKGTTTPMSKKADKNIIGVDATSSEESMGIVPKQPLLSDQISGVAGKSAVISTDAKDKLTYFELDEALQKVHDQIMATVEENKIKTTNCAEKVLRQVKMMEGRLNVSLELGDRMNEVESLVAEYAEKINALDTGLSAQMTNYQEELTQMQHDLETGLDTMAEVLANTGTDTTAVAELNTRFSNLQADIENTIYLQKNLQETQEVFEYDLLNVRKQIETLRDDKSDRDEVTDALRDKAGLAELNGLVTTEQFDAVRGDFEKQIILAYDKFNNQEAYWQKAIDDLIKDLNDKADKVQVQSLGDEVTRNITTLTAKLKAMEDIVGEPPAAAVSKKLHRDEECLSCATPAHLESKAPKVPALPGLRPPAIGAEAPRPGGPRRGELGEGDYELCYPGKPIPHPIDPRAQICKRWCGSLHTAVLPKASAGLPKASAGLPTASAGLPRAPVGITISTIVRDTTTTVEVDEKVPLTDGPLKKPCKPCYVQPPPPPQAEPELAEEAEDTEQTLPPTTTMDECLCFPICGVLHR